MFSFKRLLLLFVIFLLAGCKDGWRLPLAFPTPGKQALVVLTRPGPLTYATDENDSISGLEYDLTETFAQELGVEVKYIVASPGELKEQIGGYHYHLAAAWLSPRPEDGITASPPVFMSHDVLAQHEASLPLSKLSQLAGKTVHALAGSRQAATLKRLRATQPGLTVVEVAEGDMLDLLEALGERQVDYVAMDSQMEELANQFVPSLRTTLRLDEDAPIVWLLGASPNPELQARVDAFIVRVQQDGTLARLEERYFGHVRRLRQGDIQAFLGEVETTLPKLRPHFQAAERITGLDWRLLAALAYQESHWKADATSPTGVRGIMMLTAETADRLGVENRLDARASILAGARYLNLLRDMLPPEVTEPDRTWLALAGYNLGPGHLSTGRSLARQLKADPDAWYEMKRILPLLAKPEYYQRMRSGRARGGEAVILVENIRSYYDILTRHEGPLVQPAPTTPQATKVSKRQGARAQIKKQAPRNKR